jgi:Ca2+-binding RTX toxin-like protein
MGENGATVSAAGSTKNLLMLGSNNDAADYITGGSGKDTIYAGADDSVYGGLGNDLIVLGDGSRQVVGLASSGGKDTVANFVAGTEDTSDVVYLFDGISKASASFNNDGRLVIKSGTASLLLEDVTESGSILVTDSTGEIETIGIATSGAVIQVTGDLANGYVAKNGSVDFTNASDDVEIDLGNENKYGKKMTTFDGIIAATGTSNGSNKLVGAASKKNTLQGGAGGDNSIYGGGSANDYLVGGAEAEDIFYYGTGEGSDTISGYEVGKDVVDVWGSATDGYIDGSGNLRIKWADGKKLTISTSGGSADENTIVTYSTDNAKTTAGLKVGRRDEQNNFTYDENVNCYYGGKKGDTLTISTADDAKIWLDNSHGVSYSGITTLDGSAASGAVELAGSAKGDYITGGTGESSLWGGAGGNDTMTGGSGENTFYFGMGEGKDVITAANDGDKVMLYNVSLANVASAGLTDSGSMLIKLTDGSTLTIEGAAVSTFQLADGTWTYDKDAKEWNQA